jgi:hypothetical protein
VAAVDGLRAEYEGRVEFTIISPEETAERGAELEALHLISRGHGLVAFDQAGEAVVTIAGHNFGEDEILMAVGQVVSP